MYSENTVQFKQGKQNTTKSTDQRLSRAFFPSPIWPRAITRRRRLLLLLLRRRHRRRRPLRQRRRSVYPMYTPLAMTILKQS
jgi:hypothetical protein